jgi:hypothetical protein
LDRSCSNTPAYSAARVRVEAQCRFDARQKLLRLTDRVPGRLKLFAQLRNLVAGMLNQRLRLNHKIAMFRVHRIAATVVNYNRQTRIWVPRGGLDEDRLRRAKYLGALADRLFRNECARLGLNADEAIKSPLLSIIARQGGRVVTNREKVPDCC